MRLLRVLDCYIMVQESVFSRETTNLACLIHSHAVQQQVDRYLAKGYIAGPTRENHSEISSPMPWQQYQNRIHPMYGL